MLIKRVSRFTFTALVCFFSTALFSVSVVSQTNSLTLAATPFETYVNDDGEPARVNELVLAAFSQTETDVKAKVMRQAFLGSSVRSGKVDGEYAYVDMGQSLGNVLTSEVFLPLYLYAASKDADVENIKIFQHLKRNRVAVENRFANTPNFRLLKDIKWSRNPSTFDAFRQLADDRAPYLVTSELLIREFNTLLANDSEETLHFSSQPLIKSGFQLAIRDDVANAKEIIAKFNAAISTMQKSGEYNTLLGISWLRKDINNDGIADYIGHTDITRETSLLKTAYRLDNTPTSDNSLFVINGETFSSKALADEKLSSVSAEVEERISLLDATTYETLLQRW